MVGAPLIDVLRPEPPHFPLAWDGFNLKWQEVDNCCFASPTWSCFFPTNFLVPGQPCRENKNREAILFSLCPSRPRAR